MVELDLLFIAGLLFCLLAVAGAVALRLDQSVIPAYIVVGILVGPYAPSINGISLRLVENPDLVRLLADLGVVLLLFFVGVELSLGQLLSTRRKFLRAGAVDIGISFPLGFGLGVWFGFTWLEAGFVALIFSTSRQSSSRSRSSIRGGSSIQRVRRFSA